MNMGEIIQIMGEYPQKTNPKRVLAHKVNMRWVHGQLTLVYRSLGFHDLESNFVFVMIFA